MTQAHGAAVRSKPVSCSCQTQAPAVTQLMLDHTVYPLETQWRWEGHWLGFSRGSQALCKAGLKSGWAWCHLLKYVCHTLGWAQSLIRDHCQGAPSKAVWAAQKGCLPFQAFPGLPKPGEQELCVTTWLHLSLFNFVLKLSSFLYHCTWEFIILVSPASPAPLHTA